jgi:hypothetical protein
MGLHAKKAGGNIRKMTHQKPDVFLLYSNSAALWQRLSQSLDIFNLPSRTEGGGDGKRWSDFMECTSATAHVKQIEFVHSLCIEGVVS